MLAGLFALCLLQEGGIYAPSPTPDRYSDSEDAALYEVFGPGETLNGKRRPGLVQRRALRPRYWTVYDDSEVLVAQRIVRGADWKTGGRLREQSDVGPLQGRFQAAVTTVFADEDHVRFVRAPGASAVFVNGEGFAADPDRRGWLGFPVGLRDGANEVLVAGVQGGFELEMWDPVSRLVVATWALHNEGLEKAWREGWGYLYFPIFNASTGTADQLHFHYGDARPPTDRPHLEEWADGGRIVPLGLIEKRVCVDLVDTAAHAKGLFLSPILVQCAKDDHATRQLIEVRFDHPQPTWPTRQARRWPPEPCARDFFFSAALLIEATGDPGMDEATLEVARFFQQRLWESAGELVSLIRQEWIDDGFTRLAHYDWVVRVGRLAEGRPGELWAGPEGTAEEDPPVYAIRGFDEVGLRMGYLVEPLLSAVEDEGTSWFAP